MKRDSVSSTNTESPVHGYITCRCGHLEIEVIWRQCGGMCFGCLSKERVSRLGELEVVNRGRRMVVPVEGAKPRNKRKLSENEVKMRRVKAAASQRALARLKNLYPDMYDILFAEERIKAGQSLPLRVGRPPRSETIKTYEAQAAYSAGATPGGLPDGVPPVQEDA